MKFVNLKTLETLKVSDEFFENLENTLPEYISSDTVSAYMRYATSHSHSPHRQLVKNAALIKGNKKPHRQKGLGVARFGSLSALQRRGGGTYGPLGGLKTPLKMNKKVKKQVFLFALKVALKNLYIYENFDYKISEDFSYKNFQSFLGFKRAVLISNKDFSEDFKKQVRNLQHLDIKEHPTVQDLFRYEKIFIEKNDLKNMVSIRMPFISLASQATSEQEA